MTLSGTAANFAGFFYDLKDDVYTESLDVSGINGNVIPEGGLDLRDHHQEC